MAANVALGRYAMQRQSLDIAVSACWTRRVVQPPLYSRAFQDRKAPIEYTEGEAHDKDLISDEYESGFKGGMQKLRVKLVQFQGGAKVRPYTSARSLRDTSRPFLPGPLRRTVAAVYVQARTDTFRFSEVPSR